MPASRASNTRWVSVLAGQHDERDEGIGAVGISADHANKIQAIDGLHIPITNDQIDGKTFQFLDRVGPVVTGADVLDPETPENFLQHQLHMLVVFDNQHIQV